MGQMTGGVNPFLPSWEYIPDGEPHVFGDRVYLYGSHDRFGGPLFCMNDYVCWSAPVTDLTQWKYEGVIYSRNQDSLNRSGRRRFYAPDVTQGPDGRYYLFYTLDFVGPIRMSVAVCDTPAGLYRFHGHVCYPDGHVWGSHSGDPYPFDPGVLTDDDGRVYLYSGFAIKMNPLASGLKNLTNPGGVGVELEADMLTMKTEPKLLLPSKGNPGAFPGHAFFEASSMRKVDGKYCYVYSSENNHELCWAMSDQPLGDYSFGGTLVDIGDVFLDGQTDESLGKNYLGNTHGGLLEVGGQWYTFYHRQTNRHTYSRQMCAEKLTRDAAGGFRQAEITSCGFSPEPLPGEGVYEARIACNLWSKQGVARVDVPLSKWKLRKHPYFTQTGKDREGQGDQYIANMRDGAVAGFKRFRFTFSPVLRLILGGHGQGVMEVSTRPDFGEIHASVPVSLAGNALTDFEGSTTIPAGDHPLYFRYCGQGAIDFHTFFLLRKK